MKYLLLGCFIVVTILSYPYLTESGSQTAGVVPENTFSTKEPECYLDHSDVDIMNNGNIRIRGYLKNASVTLDPNDNRISLALEMDHLSDQDNEMLAKGYCYPEDTGKIIFPQELHDSPVEIIVREGTYIYPINSIRPLKDGTANISVAELEDKAGKIIGFQGRPGEVYIIRFVS